VDALGTTIKLVRTLCDGESEEDRAKLTIMVTDGNTTAGIQSGKELFWSTYKKRCADHDTCPTLFPERDEMVGVDWRMRLSRPTLDDRRHLSVVAG